MAKKASLTPWQAYERQYNRSAKYQEARYGVAPARDKMTKEEFEYTLDLVRGQDRTAGGKSSGARLAEQIARDEVYYASRKQTKALLEAYQQLKKASDAGLIQSAVPVTTRGELRARGVAVLADQLSELNETFKALGVSNSYERRALISEMVFGST